MTNSRTFLPKFYGFTWGSLDRAAPAGPLHRLSRRTHTLSLWQDPSWVLRMGASDVTLEVHSDALDGFLFPLGHVYLRTAFRLVFFYICWFMEVPFLLPLPPYTCWLTDHADLSPCCYT
jgi:hypothetical protein